jgi:GTP cyclohydrolase IA
MTTTRNFTADDGSEPLPCECVPMSEQIKHRLKQNGVRFFANDNISDHLTDQERDLLVDEIETKFQGVLDSLVIDTQHDPNSAQTARRLAKMYVHEIMRGRYYPAPDVAAFPNEGDTSYDGMLVIRSEIKSVCSHHHQPVTGVAYIGIIPSGKVIGLSKYSRIAQWCARRGTLQEELCTDIAKAIMKACDTQNVGVYLEFEHGCCTNRGIMAHSSLTQTTVLRGSFMSDPSTKKEFFDNIALQSRNGK